MIRIYISKIERTKKKKTENEKTNSNIPFRYYYYYFINIYIYTTITTITIRQKPYTHSHTHTTINFPPLPFSLHSLYYCLAHSRNKLIDSHYCIIYKMNIDPHEHFIINNCYTLPHLFIIIIYYYYFIQQITSFLLLTVPLPLYIK
jgi:hypothetical protein